MTKNNFLLVDLEDSKTKKLANTITSDTSRKILNCLADKDEAEAKIGEKLGLPISTVHYHLQKLQEAGLVTVEEFHYSQKGREVNHYKLANKYIIIAPKKIQGLKEKLKGILPVGLIVLGISAVIELLSKTSSSSLVMEAAPKMAESYAADSAMMLTAPTAISTGVSSGPSIALWFLLGSITTLGLYVLYQFVLKKRLEKEN